MLTTQVISGFAGVLLSLLMSFTPGLKDWYNKVGGAQNETWQRLIMAGLIVLVGLGALGLSCLNVHGLPYVLDCSDTGAVALAENVFWALVGSQSTHHLTG